MADIIIFGKSGWPYTQEARSAFGSRARYRDVRDDPGALQEMLKHSKGSRQVPVIVEGEKVSIGYGGS